MKNKQVIDDKGRTRKMEIGEIGKWAMEKEACRGSCRKGATADKPAKW